METGRRTILSFLAYFVVFAGIDLALRSSLLGALFTPILTETALVRYGPRLSWAGVGFRCVAIALATITLHYFYTIGILYKGRGEEVHLLEFALAIIVGMGQLGVAITYRWLCEIALRHIRNGCKRWIAND